MTRPFPIAVFASGDGSNFQALADAAAAGRLGGAEIALLVCDKPQARVVERAREAGIPSFVFRPKDYPSRAAYEADIVRELESRGVELVVLAGYMRLLTETLLTPYENRIVNVHPSLLPAFPGLDALGQALAHGAKVTGVTVHYVDGGMDTGPIIAQRAIPIAEDDTAETLAERVHAVEHVLYGEAVRVIAEGRVRLEGRRVRIVPEA
ncbi:phosphoribosylglycinamide formyltransferase [Paenibacillus sp. J31TS4]|uniref:phosphoribosylglycinamide formyltransferase n=1 Tax=Paenibacillus sp. J31TS4 TaxID=2807195 RepID=UPI001B0840C9|nr:phosphoribosylglycinamide formyltransferase [Paenibacillus sp. J31TS4]GIP38950.1 phosphoribosylglycinamide formyltransferase [Paenibacillus sp. J31TS4]